MVSFANVELRLFEEASFTCRTLGTHLTLNIDNVKLLFFRRSELLMEFTIGRDLSISRLSHMTAVIVKRGKKESVITPYIVTFSSLKDVTLFLNSGDLNSNCTGSPIAELSSFEKRTDSWSAVQYFQFYSYLSQQQNMMQDYVRTSTYQRAILANAAGDFRGKVVLDVGAGSGILSFFAIQAGAKKVYAVEASNMAAHCNVLVQANKLAGRIIVISGKIEEITLPEPVDIIISEPMGYMLYNERMLETYVHARKFLAPHLRQTSRNNKAHRRGMSESKDVALDGNDCISDEAVDRSSDFSSNASDTEQPIDEDFDSTDITNKGLPLLGLMFPTVANMYVVPFSDEALFAEQHAKANFWCQQNFHGMDLTGVRSAAMTEYFNQPIVDTFDIGLCPALPCVHKVDFRTVTETELTTIDIPLHFQINTCTTIHGLAFWFDVGFLGSQREVWLSTAPTEPLTHWYQVRCLFDTPLFVQEGQLLDGRVLMEANTRQSYDVHIELLIPGSQTKITNQLDLKNPHFRYNGYPPAPPPGSHTRSPTETYYANLCIQQQSQQLQVPAQSITVPVGNSTLVTGTNSQFTLPTAGAAAPVGQIAGIGIFPHEQGTILTTADHIQSPLHLQQMHLSPQPINNTSSTTIALSAHHPHSLNTAAAPNVAGAQMIVDQCTVPSIPDLNQHSTAFFPRIATVVPVIDQTANLTTPIIGSANGWRSNDFTIE